MRISNPSDNEQTSQSAAWKRSLVAGASACLMVFLINLSITIWSITLPEGSQNGTQTGRRILYEGSCSTSSTLSVVLHLIINIFSSILLGASNYGMQCLSAPTRDDVNKAHETQEWLDIGILSFRNLRKVSLKRAILWWLLVFSSVPLHLLFNSVVFSSLTTHNYTVYNIGDQFLLPEYNDFSDKDEDPIWDMIERVEAGVLDNLTTLECID
ncbi:hypothetical protein BFJ68_g17087, partial [Fusarium oxysporum]